MKVPAVRGAAGGGCERHRPSPVAKHNFIDDGSRDVDGFSAALGKAECEPDVRSSVNPMFSVLLNN